jgi:hypothetical protein
LIKASAIMPDTVVYFPTTSPFTNTSSCASVPEAQFTLHNLRGAIDPRESIRSTSS